MKTKFGIVGCGFLGGIVANAWKNGLLADYEPLIRWDCALPIRRN